MLHKQLWAIAYGHYYFVSKSCMHVKLLLNSVCNNNYAPIKGGLFALRVSMEHGDLLAGMILESPFIAPSDAAIGWHKTFGAQMLSFVLPELKLPLLDPNTLSTDTLTVRSLIADPLCSVNLGMSTNLIALLSREIKRLDNVVPLITKPFW